MTSAELTPRSNQAVTVVAVMLDIFQTRHAKRDETAAGPAPATGGVGRVNMAQHTCTRTYT